MRSYNLKYIKGGKECEQKLTHVVDIKYAPVFELAVCILEYVQCRFTLYDKLNPNGSRPVTVIDQYRDSHGFHVVRGFLHELDEDWITIYSEGPWMCWVRKSRYNALPERLQRGLKESWSLMKDIKDVIPFA